MRSTYWRSPWSLGGVPKRSRRSPLASAKKCSSRAGRSARVSSLMGIFMWCVLDRAPDAKLFRLADPVEGGPCRRQRRVDVAVSVRGGDKPCFIGRRREIDALLEHGVEEAIETRAVALHHFGERLRRRRAEVNPEHAADRLR